MITDSLVFSSPIGRIRLDATEAGLSRVIFVQDATEITESASGKFLKTVKQQIMEYLSNHRKIFEIELDLTNTNSFTQEILSLVRQIPFGETKSYGEIAKMMGRPMATRAVGQALAQNPLLIIVPCHRVVSVDRQLTGFAGGLEIKKRLLELEGHKIVGEKLA